MYEIRDDGVLVLPVMSLPNTPGRDGGGELPAPVDVPTLHHLPGLPYAEYRDAWLSHHAECATCAAADLDAPLCYLGDALIRAASLAMSNQRDVLAPRN